MHRIGGGRMLLTGLGARLVLLAVLTPLGLWHDGWTGWLILLGFALIQFVWPLLSVAANSLSVRLAPAARGESVGLFNAATSLAASGGSALAGVIFGVTGFWCIGGIRKPRGGCGAGPERAVAAEHDGTRLTVPMGGTRAAPGKGRPHGAGHAFGSST